MKNIPLISIMLLIFLLIQPAGTANAQAIAIKKWKGRYPRMNNNYPHSFIAFKGWLPPKPHLFIKTPLTHYYLKVKSMPATDSGEIAGKTKTGLMRLLAKLMERSQFKGRYQKTTLIKNMNEQQKQIGQKLFDSRSDHLEDIYGLSDAFIALYKKLDDLEPLEKGEQVKKILTREADELLQQFLMINLLESEHADKLQAFTDLQNSLHRLRGEVDYTLAKMKFFRLFNKSYTADYAFLTQ